MKYTLFILLSLYMLSSCKKAEPIPATFFNATLDGQTYPAPGQYNGWTNIPNGISLAGDDSTSFRITSTAWVSNDTIYNNGVATATKIARLEFDIIKVDDTNNPLNDHALNKALFIPGSIPYLMQGNSLPYYVDIIINDAQGFPLYSTAQGDNTASYFTIVDNSPNSTSISNGLFFQTTYAAKFSCKLYDNMGKAHLFAGNLKCYVEY